MKQGSLFCSKCRLGLLKKHLCPVPSISRIQSNSHRNQFVLQTYALRYEPPIYSLLVNVEAETQLCITLRFLLT